jgi:hypothetical protein
MVSLSPTRTYTEEMKIPAGHIIKMRLNNKTYGPGSSVGIATDYGLDGPGIKSRWGRDFSHTSRPTLGPPSLLYNGYQVFPGGKEVWC